MNVLQGIMIIKRRMMLMVMLMPVEMAVVRRIREFLNSGSDPRMNPNMAECHVCGMRQRCSGFRRRQ